jgi:hypothetical protein
VTVLVHIQVHVDSTRTEPAYSENDPYAIMENTQAGLFILENTLLSPTEMSPDVMEENVTRGKRNNEKT